MNPSKNMEPLKVPRCMSKEYALPACTVKASRSGSRTLRGSRDRQRLGASLKWESQAFFSHSSPAKQGKEQQMTTDEKKLQRKAYWREIDARLEAPVEGEVDAARAD